MNICKSLPSKQSLQYSFTYKNGFLIRRKTGLVAGWKEKNGYWATNVNGIRYRLHRLIFQFHYGWCPEFVDHIDGNKDNNLIENLREATYSQNNHNKTHTKNNKLGVKGVCIERGKYKANIKINGKSKHLGYFKTVEEASLAYEKSAKENYRDYFNSGRHRTDEGIRSSGVDQTAQREDADSWIDRSLAMVARPLNGNGKNQRRVRYFGFETTH